MKILSKKKCEEILKRITANEIIQIEYGLHDMEAETKATENRAEIAYIIGGVKGMNKVQNTLRKRYNNNKKSKKGIGCAHIKPRFPFGRFRMYKKKIKCEIYRDSMQNYKKYATPPAQLIIAGVPYNVGTNFYGSNPMWYNGGDNKNGESKLAKKAAFNSDFNFNLYEYFHFCSKMLKKEDTKPIARGRSSNSPCMIVFCSFEQLSTLIAAAKKHGFVNYIPLVFCKNYSPQVLKANMRIVGAMEYALVLYRDRLPKFRNGCLQDENGKNIRGTGHMIFNWFTWEKDGKDVPKIHPAQKPVAVLKKLIEIFTDEGDVVIDPCCGSGSTLRAAAELDRSAYGFEIDRNFYERAKNEMLVFEKYSQIDISDFIGDTV